MGTTVYSVEDCCAAIPAPNIPPGIIIGPPGPAGPQGPAGPPGDDGVCPDCEDGCEWCCPIFCGEDSPEGVVAGPIGAPYEQTNAAITTHSLWIKREGVGNTGWRGWAGLRGEAAGSFAIGDNAVGSGVDAIAFGEDAVASGLRAEAFGKSSVASGVDAKAFGAGATVASDRGIGIGAGATVLVASTEGISIGDGTTRSINDISVGWSHDFGAAVARGSILIGKNATINTAADSSSSTVADYGGHILIGEDTETPYAASQFHNVVVGWKAKARGRACVIIGDQAETRAADNPVVGRSEGRFAVIIGDRSKGSGGCIVAIGDQADARGDNTAAVGTHTRANDHDTAAFGPNCFAGSLTSDNSGASAVALGVSAVSRGANATAVGNSNSALAPRSINIGHAQSINAAHTGAIVIGSQADSTTPSQLRIGSATEPILAVYFNGSAIPGLLISLEGQVTLNDSLPDAALTLPIAGNHTLTEDNSVLTFSTTGGNRTLTLPASATISLDKRYYIRRDTAGANTLTIDADGAELIDGAGTYILTGQWEWAILRNNQAAGNEWVIDDFGP